MVDTVVLVLQSNQFKIHPNYYTRFSPSVRNFFIPPYADFGSRKSLKADCNPTAVDKATGDYYPRLTLFKAVRKGGIQTFLHIEFSVPKIIYGNNFDEVEDYEFDYLCVQLHRRLQRYGVLVESPAVIKNADVKAIHYSKNVELTDYTTASSIIKEMGKANISTRNDINVSDYRNTGEAVKFHTNTWEFIIYDKLKDLKKAHVSDKGRFSSDNYSQLSLFEQQPVRRPFEVIRLEARYGDKIRLKMALNKAGVTNTPVLTFNKLYSEAIAKKMLQYELLKVKDAYPNVLLSKADNLETLYADLTIQNPQATLKSKFEAIAYRAMLNETGSRDIRTLGNDKPAEWYKLQQRLKKLKLTERDNNCFTVLDEALRKFKPLKLKHHLEKRKVDI